MKIIVKYVTDGVWNMSRRIFSLFVLTFNNKCSDMEKRFGILWKEFHPLCTC